MNKELIQDPDDHFDRLSDELLSLIFNKVHDAKSLSRCSLVSKRFASLITQTDTVSLTVISSNGFKTKRRQSFFLKLWKLLLLKFVPKLSEDEEEYESLDFAAQVLRNFSDIKRLSIQLPCHGDELGSRGTDHSFLKWKAEFGRELESCVLLGATSFHGGRGTSAKSSRRKQKQPHEPILATDEMKTRVVWMISCLIAASTRHWLLKRIIADIPMNLQSVTISDSSKQGKIIMGEEQFKELRKSTNTGVPAERTAVPAARVKLWYAPALELPDCGRVMKGATLMVIRPVDRKMMKMENEDEGLGECFEGEEEEEALREAVREMLKEKPYLMQMDSF